MGDKFCFFCYMTTLDIKLLILNKRDIYKLHCRIIASLLLHQIAINNKSCHLSYIHIRSEHFFMREPDTFGPSPYKQVYIALLGLEGDYHCHLWVLNLVFDSSVCVTDRFIEVI